MPEHEVLAPLRDDAYADELSIASLPDGRIVVAWKQTSPNDEQLCWRTVNDDGLGTVHSVSSPTGHPTRPLLSPGRLLWVAMVDGHGPLMEQELDDEFAPVGETRILETFAKRDVGDCVVTTTADAETFLLAQAWCDDGAGLVLAATEGNGWRLVEDIRDGFCARPRLCCSGNEVLCAWDRYAEGRYRISTASIGSDGLADRCELVGGEDWETLPAIARGGDGAWYLARCRERLVSLEGAVSHHSCLVVSRQREGAWHDIADVDIDFALNPWMAAYWGYRRFPKLFPDAGGAWLLWEEKIDPDSMGPGPGRLCGLPMGQGREAGTPRVLLDGHSLYVLAQTSDRKMFAATKTQERAHQMHVPWMLHRWRLDTGATARPAALPSNREAPRFEPSAWCPSAPEDEGLRLLFGDPHLHSRYSRDLDGEMDELFHFARDTAGLDFIAFTENDGTRFTEPLPASDWEEIRRAARTFDDAGAFTVLTAWEYTLHRMPGRPESRHSHRSVLMPGDDSTILSWTDGTAPTPPDLVCKLKGRRVLLHHHHPTGFDLTDDDLERNIEICSGWGNWMRRPTFVDRLHEVLAGGFRMGFIGGSDNHERNPGLGGGLTGLWAEANTREAVFEALRQRRCFATTGLRPRLRFDVSGIVMGGAGDVDAPVVNTSVACDPPVTLIEIVRNGRIAATREFDACEVDWTWEDKTCLPGRHYYYAHVRFHGETPDLAWNLAPPYGADAWTSPVWVTRG